MAAKKVLDWNKVKAVLAKEDFSIVNEHRARGLELSRVLAATVPKVDLSHYKSVLENQKLVADIEAELKTFKPARADPAPILKSLKDQRVAAVKEAKETVDKVNAAVAGYKSDLQGIKALSTQEIVSAEKVYEAAPGLENVYMDRLREGKIYHDDHNFGEKLIG